MVTGLGRELDLPVQLAVIAFQQEAEGVVREADAHAAVEAVEVELELLPVVLEVDAVELLVGDPDRSRLALDRLGGEQVDLVVLAGAGHADTVPGATGVRPVERRDHALVAVGHLETTDLSVDHLEEVVHPAVGLVHSAHGRHALTVADGVDRLLQLQVGRVVGIELGAETEPQPGVLAAVGLHAGHGGDRIALVGAEPQLAIDRERLDAAGCHGHTPFTLLGGQRSETCQCRCGGQEGKFVGHHLF